MAHKTPDNQDDQPYKPPETEVNWGAHPDGFPGTDEKRYTETKQGLGDLYGQPKVIPDAIPPIPATDKRPQNRIPLLFNNPKQALDALRYLAPLESRDDAKLNEEPPLLYVQDVISSTRSLLTGSMVPATMIDWSHVFKLVAKYTRRIYQHEHEQSFNQVDEIAFAEFLLRKHELYGATPLRKWGPLGVCIRIDSKLERYMNIRANPPIAETEKHRMENNESMLDTLKDIIGYCILGYMLTLPDVQHVSDART